MPLPEATTNLVAAASLADFTRPELVVPRLRESDAAGIIGELSRALQRHGGLRDLLPFYQAALNQELLASSVMECGIAFPHARIGGVGRLQFAFGRLPHPVIWSPGGHAPAHLVFLVASPATDASGYLHLVASFSRLGQQPSNLAALREADDAGAIMRIFSGVKVSSGPAGQ